MVFLEGPMAGRVIAQRRAEILAAAARYRLACQTEQCRRTWLCCWARGMSFWLGRFLVALGRRLERQGVLYERPTAKQAF